MAKKNLMSLMDGIMGEDRKEETPVGEIRTEPAPEPKPAANVEPAPEKPAQEKSVRKGPGRPKKEAANETRATFIVNNDLLRKIKYISLVEGCMQKDVLDRALQEYIDAWQEENGRIRLPRSK